MFIGLQIMMDIVRQIGKVFNPLMPVVTKRSHILKQTCSFQLQVCLSMSDLLCYHQALKVFNIIELLLNHFSTSFSTSVLKKRTYSDHVNFSMETTVLETFTA